jgi:hypothetical protein
MCYTSLLSPAKMAQLTSSREDATLYDQTSIFTLTPVVCCQHPIMAVQLPDERIVARVQSFCEALQLDDLGQLQRIRRQPALADQLLQILVMTPSGLQEVDVLIASAIPAWLIGVQLSRLAPEKRALILSFQREVVDTPYRHFFKINTESAPPPPLEWPGNAPRSALGLWRESVRLAGEAIELLEEERRVQVEDHQAMGERQTAFEAKQAVFEARQIAFEERQVVVEEMQEAMGEHLVETRERLARLEGREPPRSGAARRQQPTARPAPPSGPLLSKDHLEQAYLLARTERSRSGQRVDTTLRALAEAFGVEDVSDLPDAVWDEALPWFWQQAGG